MLKYHLRCEASPGHPLCLFGPSCQPPWARDPHTSPRFLGGASRLPHLQKPRCQDLPGLPGLPLITIGKVAQGAGAGKAALAQGRGRGWAPSPRLSTDLPSCKIMSRRTQTLAEPGWLGVARWAVRPRAGFFSYCQEFPLPEAFIFPRNTPQLKRKEKANKRNPPRTRRLSFSVRP